MEQVRRSHNAAASEGKSLPPYIDIGGVNVLAAVGACGARSVTSFASARPARVHKIAGAEPITRQLPLVIPAGARQVALGASPILRAHARGIDARAPVQAAGRALGVDWGCEPSGRAHHQGNGERSPARFEMTRRQDRERKREGENAEAGRRWLCGAQPSAGARRWVSL